jgi:PAS domain S-box-containing protein
MKRKLLRTTEHEFNELFLASIDEALSSLGESAKTAIYFHLEQKFHIKKQEIPYCLNSFAEALDALFGLGCKPLELMFMQKLHSKVKGKFGPINPEDFTFTKYVNMVKRNISSSDDNSKKVNQVGKHNKNSQPDPETNFMTLLNFLADPVVVVDEKGRFLLINNAFESFTGLNKEKEIGKFFLEMKNLPVESKNILFENLKKRKMGLPVEPYEISVTIETGEVRFVEVKAKIIEYAGQPADLVILRDVTRRKSNERRLKEYSEKLETLVDAKTKEISESEEKFRSIVENSNDVVMLTLPDGAISYLSPACFSVLGYNSEDLVGKRSSIFHPDDVEKVSNTLAGALTGERGSDFEYRIITKTGETRWISHSWSPILENGRVKLIVSMVRDITERKQLEDDLRVSEERFRAISNSAMDAIVLMDDSCKINYWNPAAERIFGYAKEEVIGKDMKTVIVPSDHREFCLRFAKEVLENKDENHGKTIEFNALRKGQTEFPIEVSATALKLHDRNCLLSIMRDVSERKKMEAAIKADLDMLEALTENVGVGFVTISKDYRVLWANRFVKNNVGDVEGKQCYASLNTLDHICPDCGVKKVFEDGVAKDSHEYSQIGVDGNPYYVELIATPFKDKDGNVTAALECVVDIAEKKRMQSKLIEYSKKLEKLVKERTEQLQQTQVKLVKAERLAAIGELAGMVGHDLRNPLTSIKGATYYLKAKCSQGLDATGKMMLSTIDNSIEYSDKIINDLLDYSRDIKLKLAGTTPKSLLKNTLALIEVPEKIKITDETEDTPIFKADTGKISRVFVNIIANAFDAMPQGGTFTITSREVKGSVEIVFKDTGTGMNQETLNKLWTPLFTTKAKGMGFGLPICKRIVEAHGGRIFVESAPGVGTTFTVTLPVDPKPANENEDPWVFNSPVESVVATT